MNQYGVMGHPIQHSWSPRIHQLFATQTNQQLIYEAIFVPVDGFAQALNDFQAQGGKGLNITLPFKQQACEFVDALSERAKLANAVNTIQFNSDGSRFGDNTDGVGFIRDVTLNHKFPILNKRVLVLGAGGAVRGIIDPLLKQSPSSIIVANRTQENARALVAEFSHSNINIKACSLSELAQLEFDLIVNGTSAGLFGDHIDLSGNILSAHAYCYEMVYGKEATPFMQWGLKNNAAIVSDGLGMLIEQAAESFYIWRGIRPDTQAVFNYFASSHQ